MDRDQIISTLRAALPELSARFGVERVLLFGSFARGDQTEGSDVDLLVDLSRPITLFGLGALQARLEAIVGRRVEVGTLDSLRPHVQRGVMAEALRVA